MPTMRGATCRCAVCSSKKAIELQMDAGEQRHTPTALRELDERVATVVVQTEPVVEGAQPGDGLRLLRVET